MGSLILIGVLLVQKGGNKCFNKNGGAVILFGFVVSVTLDQGASLVVVIWFLQFTIFKHVVSC